MRALNRLLPLAILFSPLQGAPVLDARKLFAAQDFWDNRDFGWFANNIPLLDSPDAEINTTYYYRWELVTKHLTYGSPDTGYLFTEFINRPFWSGAYGGISCPSGHQLNEVRWLRDPRYGRDYLKYWYHTPGAQPRNYSTWLADSAWGMHLVHPDKAFTKELLPDLKQDFEGWEKRAWVPEAGLFWQVGHDDGMEFNIASRQTKNILSGAPSYRPSFNAYMWADLQGLANISELAGDASAAAGYRKRADELKHQLQQKLWDAKRGFFFPMFRDDETDKEGNRVEKNTLMYQTGRYAGSDHGRELAGYVPWAFNMPDAGYEDAWKFLMDPYYFYSDFGPTTTERNDPQFHLSESCCWWSGQSWPFATTQTLKGLANLLHRYNQKQVTRADYLKLLHNYAAYQRKNGKPYIAEALNPDTGSWEGHDGYYRSEHYFHSGFTDLVITGLAGLDVADSDVLTVDPLVPQDWDYFAMEGIPYRGHQVTILWDKTGSRYRQGPGLQVRVDGKTIASSPELRKLSGTLPAAIKEPVQVTRVNHAVNNDGNYYPRLEASHTGPGSSQAFLQDGNTAWYHLHPPLRWTSEGSPTEMNWVTVDFGTPRLVDEVKLHLLDDGPDQPVVAPLAFDLQFRDPRGSWNPLSGQQRDPEKPAGHRPNSTHFPQITATGLRVTFKSPAGKRSGMTEIEAWGPAAKPYPIASPPAGNLAWKRDAEFPKASASFSDRFGGTPERAIDGKVIYRPTPNNRWTSYGSPNASDWLALDFGQPRKVGKVVLHIYDDGGGVRPPKAYQVETFQDGQWREVPGQVKSPAAPAGSMANTVAFPPVTTEKLRVVFTHIGEGDSRSGVTEMEVWEE